MEQRVIEVIKQASAGSLDGSLSFPQVVEKLLAGGVSHYHADLLRFEKTFYLRDDGSHVEPLSHAPEAIGGEFRQEEVIAAIRASQLDRQPYSQFLCRIRKAGCVGYMAYLDGRKVVYFGRKGEEHVELFPPLHAAAPAHGS